MQKDIPLTWNLKIPVKQMSKNCIQKMNMKYWRICARNRCMSIIRINHSKLSVGLTYNGTHGVARKWIYGVGRLVNSKLYTSKALTIYTCCECWGILLSQAFHNVRCIQVPASQSSQFGSLSKGLPEQASTSVTPLHIEHWRYEVNLHAHLHHWVLKEKIT